MHSSSSVRRRHAFVPWLAALVIGATAHAGWLVHELRHHDESSHARATAPALDLRIDLKERRADRSLRALDLRIDLGGPEADRGARTRSRGARRGSRRSADRAVPRCRHASFDPREDPSLDDPGLDMWVQQVDRYRYQIDRQALDTVNLADEAVALARASLGIRERSLTLAEPIELHNIRRGTPLFALGLRNGDRLLSLAAHGAGELERMELAVERRGRPISLVYELI